VSGCVVVGGGLEQRTGWENRQWNVQQLSGLSQSSVSTTGAAQVVELQLIVQHSCSTVAAQSQHSRQHSRSTVASTVAAAQRCAAMHCVLRVTTQKHFQGSSAKVEAVLAASMLAWLY
jgi:hypothetical protein